jgi:hypothetical protein
MIILPEVWKLVPVFPPPPDMDVVGVAAGEVVEDDEELGPPLQPVASTTVNISVAIHWAMDGKGRRRLSWPRSRSRRKVRDLAAVSSIGPTCQFRLQEVNSADRRRRRSGSYLLHHPNERDRHGTSHHPALHLVQTGQDRGEESHELITNGLDQPRQQRTYYLSADPNCITWDQVTLKQVEQDALDWSGLMIFTV